MMKSEVKLPTRSLRTRLRVCPWTQTPVSSSQKTRFSSILGEISSLCYEDAPAGFMRRRREASGCLHTAWALTFEQWLGLLCSPQQGKESGRLSFLEKKTFQKKKKKKEKEELLKPSILESPWSVAPQKGATRGTLWASFGAQPVTRRKVKNPGWQNKAAAVVPRRRLWQVDNEVPPVVTYFHILRSK